MNKQISLSYLSDELACVRTKKKEFLARIEQIIPWGEWETMIQPYHYKGERGNLVRCCLKKCQLERNDIVEELESIGEKFIVSG